MARENFEIQIMREGRWVTESARDTEADARQLAAKFLSDQKCAGARVVRNRMGSGGISETVIFEKTQSVSGDGPVRIVRVETVPGRCERPRDYFGLDSRLVINRIFRDYFEQAFLTPTELLHSARELARIQDKDTLVPSAVDLVAGLQTKDGAMPAKERREEIFAAIDQITAQARRADGMRLPKVEGRLSELIVQLGSGSEPPEYLAMVALSRELIPIKNWIGKLDRVVKMALDETNMQAGLLLDAIVADVVGANVIQELLGWQPSLGSAIIGMIDFSEGVFTGKSEAPEVAEGLNRLLKANRLPATRHCLMDRALKQLKSSNPLHRNNPGQEMDEYRRVLERLLTAGGLMETPDAAEALTVRGSRFVEQGGATGRRAAISSTVHAMPDRAHGVMYLAQLSRTDMGSGHLDDIVKELDGVFGARVIGELTRRSLSPKERMINATNAHKAAVGSNLPDAIKSKVAEHIDGVLERYLVDENIIDKLDDPSAILRDRAVRLVKFCGAGVLPEGKALTRARKRVVQLLRQPHFDEHFVEGINDPAKAAKALRDFHQLLVRSGFG